MISRKRTLVWTLGSLLLSTAVAAEDPAPAPAAAEPAAEEPAAADASADAAVVPPAAADPAAADSATAPMDESAQAPAEAQTAEAPTAEAAPAPAAAPALGAIAYDSQGHQGRIHVVVKGDTLWAISNMYLATPWVWPSIWKDNGDIANPHRIYPGDRIWITPNEMRRLTPEEAAQMMANQPAAPAEEAPPAAIEDAVPSAQEMAPAAPPRMVLVSAREDAGLISPEVYKASASVVSRVPLRVLVAQEDQVYIGLGEDEVKVGDEFTVFRTNQKVVDPDTGALLGYHVEFLGWVKVEETSPETSLARIKMSNSEIEQGDRVMPREVLPHEIEVQSTPDGVDGKITFFPGRRTQIGFQDFVYLNRGTLDGLQVGSPLEVYRSGYSARETTRDERVAVPDRVVAKMLVVRTEEQTAVAYVTSTSTELELGDKFRGESASQSH
jgi:LysM domain-containing protein